MKNWKMKTLAVTGLTLGAAASAHATENPIGAAINAAIAAGQANVSITVTGLITMAALGFGVAMVVGFLRR